MKKTPAKPAKTKTPVRPVAPRTLDDVRGGTWTDGGITASDDWETPVT